MPDSSIVCPHCQASFALTEAVAAPLLEAARRQHEESVRLAEKRVKAEGAQQLADVRAQMQLQEAKLREAQQAQADVVRQKRALDDLMREEALKIQEGINQGLGQARTQAKREAEDALKLKVMEKDQAIASMQQKIEELKQKADQGSQQLQGEVQELELENMLRAKFAIDNINPVAKGDFGGDVLQGVRNASGQLCGTILWESKRTKNWSDGWLAKLRDDQRAAKAEVCVIVTQVMPKHIETFGVFEGVWVTTPRCAEGLALALRHGLIEAASSRSGAENQLTKAEMVYAYLTGQRFRLRVEAIVEVFSSQKEDLEKERKVMTKMWAKREQEIERVMQATVGMYGDLQGIAGKSLKEIDGMGLDDEAPRLLNA